MPALKCLVLYCISRERSVNLSADTILCDSTNESELEKGKKGDSHEMTKGANSIQDTIVQLRILGCQDCWILYEWR